MDEQIAEVGGILRNQIELKANRYLHEYRINPCDMSKVEIGLRVTAFADDIVCMLYRDFYELRDTLVIDEEVCREPSSWWDAVKYYLFPVGLQRWFPARLRAVRFVHSYNVAMIFPDVPMQGKLAHVYWASEARTGARVPLSKAPALPEFKKVPGA